MGMRGSFKALRVSSLVEASNMADDYPLMHTLMFLKNKF
jgi:hypothetical protein